MMTPAAPDIPASPPPPPAANPRPSPQPWILATAAMALVIILGLCGCGGICALTSGATAVGMVKAFRERGNVEKIVDAYLQAMARQDATTAYALFSTRAQRQIKLADLEKQIQGNNFALYDGYRSAQVTNINLQLVTNTNPDVPQGTVARVSGTVSYAGNMTGGFNAILEQEGNAWKLDGIWVTVPPDKMAQ